MIGVPPRGVSEGEMETVLGSEAHLRSHTVIYAGNVIGEQLPDRQQGEYSRVESYW